MDPSPGVPGQRRQPPRPPRPGVWSQKTVCKSKCRGGAPESGGAGDSEDGPRSDGGQRGTSSKNLNMEHANQENENKDEKGQDANKGEPVALWKLVNIVYLEEIVGGSALGSPSCSVVGT